MSATAATHPTPEQLAAFSLGKLDERDAATIARHLEACAVCRQAVGKVPADSFVGLVRSVREPSSTPLPAGKLGELQPVTTDDMGDLPAEMIEHARYRLVRELGKGGMGAVYLAEHKMMGRRVAIKVLNRNVLEKPEALDRFRQEVQVAGKLDHPHIVRAFDADEAGGLNLLVMEYVEGISLAQAVQKKGPLPVTHACHYVRQAALGLQHAFEQGMVHRDIKPVNLMLTPKGQVKILDFGLARLRSEQQAGTGLTQDGAFMGTPDCIAPEQATDARQADIRADVYSLGCTLYYLLAGKPPFEGQTAVQLILAHLEKEPPPLEKARKDVPAELAAIVKKMMAKEPSQRYQTPIEVAQALAPFCKAQPKPAAQPAAAPAPPAAASPHSKTVNPTDTSKLPVAKEKPAEKRAPAKAAPAAPKKEKQTSPTAGSKRYLVIGAVVAVAVLVLAVGAVLLVPILFKRPNGTVMLEIDQAGAEVFVDDNKINVTIPGDKQPLTIEVPPKRDGRHVLKVTEGGFQAYTQEITVQPGKPEQVKVTLVPETEVAVNPVKIDVKELPTSTPGGSTTGSAKVDPTLRRAYKNRSGKWKVEGDELVQETLLEDCQLVFGDFAWRDYDFTCKVKRVGGTADIGMAYHVTGAGSSEFNRGGANNTVDFVRSGDGNDLGVLKSRPGVMQTDVWYKLSVQLRGIQCKCFLDDQLILEYEETKNQRGAVGLRTWLAAARFRDLRVTDPAGKVLFEGLPELPAIAGQWLPATEQASTSELHRLVGHGASVTNVVFSRDGRQVVSASDGAINGADTQGRLWYGVSPPSTIRVWDTETGKEVGCSPLSKPVWANRGFLKLALAPESPYLLSAIENNYPDIPSKNVRLWQIAEGKFQLRHEFPEDTRGVIDLAFTPDGRRALALGHKGAIWEWTLSDSKLVRHLPRDFDGVICTAIAPDCSRILLKRGEIRRLSRSTWPPARSQNGRTKSLGPFGVWPFPPMAGKCCPARLAGPCGCGIWRVTKSSTVLPAIRSP